MEVGVLEQHLVKLLLKKGCLTASKACIKVRKKLAKKDVAVADAAVMAALEQLLHQKGGQVALENNHLVLTQQQQQQQQQQQVTSAAAPSAAKRGTDTAHGSKRQQEAAGQEGQPVTKKRRKKDQLQPQIEEEEKHGGEAQEQQQTEKQKRKTKRKHQPEQRQQQEAEPQPEQQVHKKRRKQQKQQQEQKQQQKQQQQQQQQNGEEISGSALAERQVSGAAAGPSSGRASPAPGSDASGDPNGSGGGGGEPSEATWRADFARADVKHGKFSDAERAELQRAVADYAARKGLSTTDYSWLLQRTGGRRGRPPAEGDGGKGPVADVAAALPRRTRKSVFALLQRMYGEGRGKGAWSPEEDAHLRREVGAKGKRWKEIGAAIGRSGEQCRDRWRKIGLGDARVTGTWSDEERQRLEALVMEYLLLGGGGSGGKRPNIKTGGHRPDGRQVLDNVDWDVISERMGTRNGVQCMEQWYTRGPSMVARGEWDPKEDRLLVRALLTGGAAEEHEVDWGAAVPGRSEAQALKRWRLMLKALAPECRGSFGAAVQEAAHRIWGAARMAAAAEAAGQQDEGTAE